MLKTILVPVDGSPLSTRVIPHAAALAQAACGRLLLLQASCEYWDEQPDRDQLEAIAERARERGASVETRVYAAEHDDMARAIVEVSYAAGVDLIAMSTHGRSGLGRWLFGSVADEVLRHTHLPVLLASALCEWLWPVDRPPRVLLTLDGSPFAEAAIRPALEVAGALGAEATLLQVVHRYSYEFDDFDVETERRRARQYLEDVATSLPTRVSTVEVYGGTSSPAQSIATYALQQEFDLIAMATHGRGGLARLTLGSVALGTLQRVTMPLLLHRPVVSERESMQQEVVQTGPTVAV